MSADISISYAPEDQPTAMSIRDVFQRTGFQCWVAPRGDAATTAQANASADVIRHSQALILVLSLWANNSEASAFEVKQAAKAQIPIFVFRVQLIIPNHAWNEPLASARWIDATSGVNSEALERLKISVIRLISTPKALRDGPAREQQSQSNRFNGEKVLVYFSVQDDGITFQARVDLPDGNHRDQVMHLDSGNAFGNIPYAVLAERAGGTIPFDSDAGDGEFLKAGDTRLQNPRLKI